MNEPPDWFLAFYAAVEAVRGGDGDLEIELTSSFIHDDGNAYHFNVTVRRAEAVMEFEPDEGEA